jgi:hypothetical protein
MVGSRGGFQTKDYQRSHLRDLSDLLSRNYRAKRSALATTVFSAVPELRVATGIPVGSASRCNGACANALLRSKDPIWEKECVRLTQILAECMDVVATLMES